MTDNKNQPAFASVGYGEGGNGYMQPGLTKIEYFAGLAMQGLISNPNIRRPQNDEPEVLEEFSRVAVEYAEGLLKALDKLNKS